MISWTWLIGVAIMFFCFGYYWCAIRMARIIAKMRIEHHKELRKMSVRRLMWTRFIDDRGRGKS